MIRAYAAASLPEVISWHDAGAIPAGTAAHCVTSRLRVDNPDADDEELEFLATVAARGEVTQGRPAVVAVDARVSADGTLAADVPVAAWAALFVDDLEWYAVSEVDSLR